MSKLSFVHQFVLVTGLVCSPPLVSLRGQASSDQRISHALANQHVLAANLASANPVVRRDAARIAVKLRASAVGAELRRALIGALEHENIARASGEIEAHPGNLADADFRLNVTEALVSLRHPDAIPVLVDALATRRDIADALADFGEPAIGPVARIVVSPVSDVALINAGLITLRFLTESQTRASLNVAAQSEIRQAATFRLTNPQQNVTTVWLAIDLAAATHDAALLGLVASFASDAGRIRAIGIVDAQAVADTRQRAVDRLAGVLAQPRHR